MEKIRRKAVSNAGMTIALALAVFLIAVLFASTMLSASLSTLYNAEKMVEDEQSAYAVASAARMLEDVVIHCTVQETESYTATVTEQENGAPEVSYEANPTKSYACYYKDGSPVEIDVLINGIKKMVEDPAGNNKLDFTVYREDGAGGKSLKVNITLSAGSENSFTAFLYTESYTVGTDTAYVNPTVISFQPNEDVREEYGDQPFTNSADVIYSLRLKEKVITTYHWVVTRVTKSG